MLAVKDHVNSGEQLATLTKRYNTVLELLGEKTETIDELRADIQDMKTLFKEQLEAAIK